MDDASTITTEALGAPPTGTGRRTASRVTRWVIALATVGVFVYGVISYQAGSNAEDRAATARRTTARNRAATAAVQRETESTNHIADGPIGDAERVAQAVSKIDNASEPIIRSANQADDLLGRAVDLANNGDIGGATAIYAGDAAAVVQRMQDSLAAARALLADAQQASATLQASAK